MEGNYEGDQGSFPVDYRVEDNDENNKLSYVWYIHFHELYG